MRKKTRTRKRGKGCKKIIIINTRGGQKVKITTLTMTTGASGTLVQRNGHPCGTGTK